MCENVRVVGGVCVGSVGCVKSSDCAYELGVWCDF